MLLAVLTVFALVLNTQAGAPKANPHPTTRIGENALGYVISYENVPLFDLIMYVSDLHMSMAAALNVDASEVTAVNIDSNNQLNTITISYVVSYNEGSASLLSDHNSFYVTRLEPEFAKVQGLAELLGIGVAQTTTTTTVVQTTSSPVSVYILSGSYDSSALQQYISDMEQVMASLLGISSSMVTVQIGVSGGVTTVTFYVTGEDYSSTFAASGFETSLLNSLAGVPGLNAELGLVTYTSNYVLVGAFDVSSVSAIESSLINAMAAYLGVDPSTITVSVTPTTITWIFVSNVDYSSTLSSSDFADGFNTYLSNDPALNTVLGIGSGPTTTTVYVWSGEFDTVILPFFENDLRDAMAVVLGISPTEIASVVIAADTQNAGDITWTIQGDFTSRVSAPGFDSELESQMATVPVLVSFMTLDTSSTDTSTIYSLTGSWTAADLGPYASELEQAMATAVGVSADDVTLSITSSTNGVTTLTWTISGDFQAVTSSSDFYPTLESNILLIPGLGDVWQSATTATITFGGVTPEQLQPYQLQLLINFMTTLQNFGLANVDFNDLSVELVPTSSGGTSMVFTIAGGDYSSVFTDDFWTSFQNSLATVPGLNTLLYTTTFQFPVVGSSTQALDSYVNDLINALSSAMGVPANQISVAYVVDSNNPNTINVVFTINGDYSSVISDNDVVNNFFTIVGGVPGLNAEMGLSAYYPFTLFGTSSNDLPTSDVMAILNDLASMLGVDPSDITYVITTTSGGQVLINFYILEPTTIIVNPNGSVTYVVTPVSGTSISDPNFTDNLWTIVVVSNPSFGDQYGDPSTSTTGIEVTTTTTPGSGTEMVSFPVSGMTPEEMEEYVDELISAMADATGVDPSDITVTLTEDPNNPGSTIVSYTLPEGTPVDTPTVSDLFDNLSEVPGLNDAMGLTSPFPLRLNGVAPEDIPEEDLQTMVEELARLLGVDPEDITYTLEQDGDDTIVNFSVREPSTLNVDPTTGAVSYQPLPTYVWTLSNPAFPESYWNNVLNSNPEFGDRYGDATSTTGVETTTTTILPTDPDSDVSFVVENATPEDLEDYVDDLISAMADATGVDPEDITVTLTEDPENPGNTIVSFDLPEGTTVDQPTMDDFFDNLSDVPGLNDDMGLTTPFSFTIEDTDPEDIPEEDLQQMVEELAELLGVDPEDITYTLVDDGDDTTVNFSVKEPTTVTVNPDGTVTYTPDPTLEIELTVSDPNFTNTFWTEVTDENPEFVERYPDTSATVTITTSVSATTTLAPETTVVTTTVLATTSALTTGAPVTTRDQQSTPEPTGFPTAIVCEDILEYKYIRTEPACFDTIGNIVFDVGTPDLNIQIIGIPANSQEVVVTLTTDAEMDILVMDSTYSGCIIGPADLFAEDEEIQGCLVSEIGRSFTEGMKITYLRNGVGDQKITIERVYGESINLQLRSRAPLVNGRVDWRWHGTYPCGRTIAECRPCETYEDCPFGENPICDGTEDVECGTPTTPLPTVSPSPTPTDSPSPAPTDSPTVPVTLRPTDSPTVPATLRPTGFPVADEQCDGQLEYKYLRTEPACFDTNGNIQFDVDSGELIQVVGIPANAQDFYAELSADGPIDIAIISSVTGECIVGHPDDGCVYDTVGTRMFEGSEITYSGYNTEGSQSIAIKLTPGYTLNLRLISKGDDINGRIDWVWHGTFPCGRTIAECRPCEEYEDCPFGETPICDGTEVVVCATDAPTDSPTVSPSSSPTDSPTRRTNAPTPAPTENICNGILEYTTVRTEPACLLTRGETEFDLSPGRYVDAVGIPENARDVEITLSVSNADTDLIIFDDRGVCVLGSDPSCLYQEDDEGTPYEHGGSYFYFSGDDSSLPVTETVSSDLVTYTVGVRVVAKDSNSVAAVGRVDYTWNGISPCGETTVTCNLCADYECPNGGTPICDGTENVICFQTDEPTSSPSPRPTSNPTNDPSPAPSSSPSPQPTPRPTASPSPQPTSGPTSAPITTTTTTATPTGRPTTSPTSGPTTSPTYSPTLSPTCREGTSEFLAARAPCEEVSGSSSFDLEAGENVSILDVPINALEFSAILSTTNGDADIQVWAQAVGQDYIECIVGATAGCLLQESGIYDGMTITFSGGDNTSPVSESIFVDTTLSFVTIQVYAPTASRGSLTYRWNGIAPCGVDSVLCVEPPSPSPTESPTADPVTSRPTDRPTTSPTSGPTTSPTRSPTDHPEPTENPTTSPTSAPSPMPTDSPTERPTNRPTLSPTDCQYPMINSVQSYPACFATQSTTSFDLAPNAEQTILFIPLNAQDFEAVMTSTTGPAELKWKESTSTLGSTLDGDVIVGAPDGEFQTSGVYTYNGLSLYYSRTSETRQSVTSDSVTLGTFVTVVAGPDGAVGQVSLGWNGVSPCGTVVTCIMPPTFSPSPSPTSGPTTSPTIAPSVRPTTSPTSGPTTSPTQSPISQPTDQPTESPVTEEPSLRPTTSPTSGPTSSPTGAPTGCPEGMSIVTRQYPACFETNTVTRFDLAPGASQTAVFIPLNAQDFEIELSATGDVNLVWSEDTTTGAVPIVGTDNSIFGTQAGTYTYQGMIVTYSGEDEDGSVSETLSSPLVSVATVVEISAGDSEGAVGSITTQWNGVSPCGIQRYCIDQPTQAPTSSPTQDPVTSTPSLRPTTSPTSGPTTSPTLTPSSSPTNAPSDAPTPCMDGMVAYVRTQQACFANQGDTGFDIDAGETLAILGVPLNAKEFEATLELTSGSTEMEIWGVGESGDLVCVYGQAPECELNEAGTTDDEMQIILGNRQIYSENNYRGATISIPAVYEFSSIQIRAITDTTGVLHYRWNGILPCGDDITSCVFAPTMPPTTSNPSPQPTDSPTESPVTSRPTNRPTTSPTSGPTTSPTVAPTPCEEPMELVQLQYPACFQTTSTTAFDLAAGARQIILFIPLNAQDFVAELNSDSSADLVWIDAETQQEIIGTSSSAGTFNYEGTTFTYSGRDTSSPIYVKLESDLVATGTYISVENNGALPAVGGVTTTWNGVSPCGAISFCQMPPTNGPTTSPTSGPTTSPTVSPTFFPTSSRPTSPPTESPTTSRPTLVPTTSPTSSPTNDPVVSQPTFRPTTSPTSQPTPMPTESPSLSPTDAPTSSPTECTPPMVRFEQQYPACFATQSTTTFDLASNTAQTILVIPLNAQDFEVTMDVNSGDADVVWFLSEDGSPGDAIVGADGAQFLNSGTYTFRDMTFTYSNEDPQTISAPAVTQATLVQVIATSPGAVGQINLQWNGISPCGTVSYCAMPPTFGPTTSPTSGPTPSPSDGPTRLPTTSRPTSFPTLDPVTSRPTLDPSTSSPTMKPSPAPIVGDRTTVTARPTTCEMGDFVEKLDEMTEELEDLEDRCAMLQDDLDELNDACSTTPTSTECNNCLISPKSQFSGSLPDSIVSLDRASQINLPVELDTGYPDQTVFVSYNGEVYVYRSDLGTDKFQRTCVGSGLEAMSCDTSRVVCSGGSVYGTNEEVAAALKLSATSRIDKVHPNCPSGCQMMDGTMMQFFQNQDSDIDVSRICVYSDEYYYIEDDGSYTYTCVGYGLETEVCPAYKMVCVGFEEASGLPTYGWFGEQARAVKKAINDYDNVYPSCPGS